MRRMSDAIGVSVACDFAALLNSPFGKTLQQKISFPLSSYNNWFWVYLVPSPPPIPRVASPFLVPNCYQYFFSIVVVPVLSMQFSSRHGPTIHSTRSFKFPLRSSLTLLHSPWHLFFLFCSIDNAFLALPSFLYFSHSSGTFTNFYASSTLIDYVPCDAWIAAAALQDAMNHSVTIPVEITIVLNTTYKRKNEPRLSDHIARFTSRISSHSNGLYPCLYRIIHTTKKRRLWWLKFSIDIMPGRAPWGNFCSSHVHFTRTGIFVLVGEVSIVRYIGSCWLEKLTSINE